MIDLSPSRLLFNLHDFACVLGFLLLLVSLAAGLIRVRQNTRNYFNLLCLLRLCYVLIHYVFLKKFYGLLRTIYVVQNLDEMFCRCLLSLLIMVSFLFWSGIPSIGENWVVKLLTVIVLNQWLIKQRPIFDSNIICFIKMSTPVFRTFSLAS